MLKNQNRAVVFAHYDINNKIQDYVVYYLKELKKIAKTLIFVSDCFLPEEELNKIKLLADVVIAKPHQEYDFGSYKRGFEYLERAGILNSFDEIIFANDSCFGPIFPLQDVWLNMSNKICDYWGISYNLSGDLLHIQSYFIVFKKRVFNSEIFKNFIYKITKQNSKDEVVRQYEIGLSQTLIDNKFLPESYLNYGCDIAGEVVFGEKISPFIKISTAKKTYLPIYKFIIKFLWHKYSLEYPQSLIYNYLKGIRQEKNIGYNIRIIRKMFFRLHLKSRKIFILDKWINF